MSIDKDAFSIELLSNGNRVVRIKKEKYGGAKDARLFGVIPEWRTVHIYLDSEYVVLTQENPTQQEVG